MESDSSEEHSTNIVQSNGCDIPPRSSFSGVGAGVCPTPSELYRGGLVRYENDPGFDEEMKQVQKAWSSHGDFYRLMGFHEAHRRSVWKSAFIEAVGMWLFTFASMGAVHASAEGDWGAKTPIVIGSFHVVLLAFFIFATAAPTGGHLNPTITFATILTGHTLPFRGLLLVIAQLVGATLGALSLNHVQVRDDSVELSGKCSYGSLGDSEAWMLEFMYTMVLLFIAFGIALDDRQGQIFGPVLAPFFISSTLGVIIASAGYFGSDGYTGPGMNFSRCFGPALVEGEFEGSDIYFVAPAAACIFHAIIYRIAPPHHQTIDTLKRSKKK